jgi:DNA-directed RNA polymerase omega subunit
MGYQPLEDLLPKSNYSIYKLIRMASMRALELADGQGKLIEIDSSTKTATIALEEILAGKVVLKAAATHLPPEGSVEVKEEKSAQEQQESLA